MRFLNTIQDVVPWTILLPVVAIVMIVALVLVAKVPIHYNVRNLVLRWWTTVLTALAFTLVVGLLMVMLAFVNGMYRMTQDTGHPENVIVLSDGATDELFSNLSILDTSDVERQPGVATDEQGRRLVSKEVYLVVNQPAPVAPGERPKRHFIQVRGIIDPEISGRVHGIELLPGGSWFSQAGVGDPNGDPSKADAIQAVVGEGVARELKVKQGDVFEVGPRKWIVVGIMKSLGSTFGSEVWANQEIVGQLFGKQSIYTAMVLKTANGQAARTLANDLKSYQKAALQALPEPEYYDKLSETSKQFSYAIYFVAIIMAIGGIFGVMNTMFAAISQRTKDIGVLRIIGFAPWQILISFFAESLLIALVGGLVGCMLSYLANGFTMTSIMSGSQGGGKSVVFRLIVDAEVIGSGLLFTLVMGGLGGLLPAVAAMRLKPLEALR